MHIGVGGGGGGGGAIFTPHTHNYNIIQNFVDLKIWLNQYQAINQVFVWSHNAAPLLRFEPTTPRAHKLVTPLLIIINLELSHTMRKCVLGISRSTR